ncbi:hypothetical protein SORBI_3010G140800 [Sorghum bicolor]|uniref:Uncharacterized protein n=1 Tax=Sorghum bicolor TaxID=4558 RepID=A0A1W0VT01_SORBI|nr:hypothetical protein SORBI_3010G140800 [Sorghum bicolor]
MSPKKRTSSRASPPLPMSPKKGGRKPAKGAWRGEHVEGAAEFQKVTGKPDLRILASNLTAILVKISNPFNKDLHPPCCISGNFKDLWSKCYLNAFKDPWSKTYLKAC